MSVRFADTAYLIALVSPADESHMIAVRLTREFDGHIVTTSAVLNELANHLAHPSNRELFLETLDRLRGNELGRIVHVDERLFAAGIGFYQDHGDKAWSLTDCISFIVMRDLGITEALTTDHHFEQAGFAALLKS